MVVRLAVFKFKLIELSFANLFWSKINVHNKECKKYFQKIPKPYMEKNCYYNCKNKEYVNISILFYLIMDEHGVGERKQFWYTLGWRT